MTLARKTALATLTLLSGVSAAFLFRAPPSARETIRTESASASQLELRAVDGFQILPEIQPPPAIHSPGAKVQLDDEGEEIILGDPLASLNSPLDRPDAPPPALSTRYASNSSGQGRVKTAANQTTPGDDGGPSAVAPEDDVDSTTIIHRVADGDTLGRLAERFLGDSARAAEILEANRDVLKSGDPLPIGVELRIPR